MAVIKAVSSKAGIGQALDYVTKEEKTEDKLVSGLHCEPDTVKDEMQATKELWGKTGGRTYKHFVQSYHEDEEWKARADQEQTRAKDQERKLLEEQLNLKKTLQKKGLQASEAISQAEEWKNQAEKSEIQIQKLLSEKQELVSTVAEQGKRIAEQTEQIEKLNEADNVLKLNAELKKQNEKLKQDKLNAEQEAEATVSSVKREYEAKGRELDRRIGEAAKQSASLKSERQSISEDIEQRATAKYLDQKKELDRVYEVERILLN